MTDYEKILWVELIGFNNREPDMGVKSYIDGLGFTPTGVSIFMWGPDFVHLHCGLEEDAEFPPGIGSYLDVWFDTPKYQGPPWHKFQLKRLVDEFHRYGVRVLFSIFPCSLGNRWHQEWVYDHQELGNVTVKGFEPWLPLISPLKRFADGSYYEDFLIDQVLRVVADYGFDGWHLADGYNHSWYQLAHADYSDDMVDQFLRHTGVTLPPEVPVTCAGDRDREDARARYIWHDLRREWIDFHVWRNEVYLRKITTRLHAVGKLVTSNTCWTRDPVEALYRYGIDYRKFTEIGLDRMIIETCSAAGEMMDFICRARFSVPFFDVLQSTVLLTKACAPDGRFLFNNCAQDITEGWSALRYFPAFMEREIMMYSNFYCYDGSGKPQKCFDGVQVCLAADIEPHEWKFLLKKWNLGFGTEAAALDGVTVVWSNRMVERELEFYLATRRSLTANILYHLIASGVRVAGSVRIEDAAKVATPLLVINPGLMPEEEQTQLLACSQTLFAVGEMGSMPAGVQSFADRGSAAPAEFRLYHAPAVSGEWSVPEIAEEEVPADLMEIKEPPSFFDEQYYRRISDGFYALAAAMVTAVAPPLVAMVNVDTLDRKFFHFEGVQLPSGKWRYFVTNENWQYILGDLQTDVPARSMEIMNEFRGRPMRFEERQDGLPGTRCFIRIPPKGVGVLDMEFEK